MAGSSLLNIVTFMVSSGFLWFLFALANSDYCGSVFESRFDYVLVGHLMETDVVADRLECQIKCINNDTCKSFNVHPAQSRANVICELNNSTRRMKPQDFKRKEGSTYYGSVKVSCSSYNQNNNGRVSDIDAKSGHCHPGYTGKKCTTAALARDCFELYRAGEKRDGVYTIKPDNRGPFKVFCDQTTGGGGWTVFQKRLDGSVDFYLGWDDYKQGFGNLSGEFWLGLEKIHRLTKQRRRRLRVDLEDFNGTEAFAEYDHFGVASEEEKYNLSLGSYNGNAGDSFSNQKGARFTTKDQDNDDRREKNCAQTYKGAWWYKSCHQSNLNGRYLKVIGTHPDHPALSCKQIQDFGIANKNAEYWIDPENNENPLNVFCDMTTDRGGWLLVLNVVIGSTGVPSKLVTTATRWLSQRPP